jgi:hypothetical protein
MIHQTYGIPAATNSGAIVWITASTTISANSARATACSTGSPRAGRRPTSSATSASATISARYTASSGRPPRSSSVRYTDSVNFQVISGGIWGP